MRLRYMSVANGMAFLTLFGLAWLLIPFTDNNLNGMPLLILAAFLFSLVLACINLIRAAASAPKEVEENKLSNQSLRRRTGKMFGIVFSVQFALIGLAAIIVFPMGLNDLFAPLVAMIVGLHFLPLARLFKIRIYYITAAMAIMAGITSFLIHTEPNRQDFVGSAMGIVLWLTAAYIFLKMKREMAIVKMGN